jgi:hypothetical protein
VRDRRGARVDLSLPSELDERDELGVETSAAAARRVEDSGVPVVETPPARQRARVATPTPESSTRGGAGERRDLRT